MIFLKKLGRGGCFIFLIVPVASIALGIHLPCTSKKLKRGFSLSFNGFFEHFVPRIKHLIPIIHLSLNERLKTILEVSY